MNRFVGLLGAALLAGAVASCTSGGAGRATSTSAVGAQTSIGGDAVSASVSATELLLAATDVRMAGLSMDSSHSDGQSTVGRYASADGARSFVDTIVLFATQADAVAALPSTENAAAQQFDAPQPRNIPAGRVYLGTSGNDALVVAVFVEGRALATLAFRTSDGGDTLTQAAVDATIAAQDGLIKASVH